MKPGLIVFLLILAVGIFYIATIRIGLPPGDDFAMYIRHAINIVEGKPYDQTGYIYNPHNPGVGPPEYPPMFPLLLAGVYKIAGMNLTAMKILNVLSFLTVLYVFYLAFNKDLPFGCIAAALVVLALNPFFWNFKDEILSDMLFLLLCYTALWMFAAGSGSRDRAPLRIGATAAVVYLAFATRTAAVVLIPALIVTDLVRVRRVKAATIATVLIASVLMMAQVNFFGGALNYAAQMQTRAIVHGAGTHVSDKGSYVWSYIHGLALFAQAFMWEIENRLWHNAVSASLTILLCLTATVLGLVGYIVRLIRGPGVFDVFALGYLAMVVLWRAVDLRLIIPLIPLWVLYAATALDAAREWAGGRAIAKGAMILTLLQVGLAYGSTYAHAQYGVIRAGIADPNFVELCLYIEQGTPRNAVFIFSLPRMLSFMTNRSASVYYRPKDDSELWDYFRTISATYVISPVETQYDRGYFAGFIARSRNQLRPVYENIGFVMYQIVPPNVSLRSWDPRHGLMLSLATHPARRSGNAQKIENSSIFERLESAFSQPFR